MPSMEQLAPAAAGARSGRRRNYSLLLVLVCCIALPVYHCLGESIGAQCSVSSEAGDCKPGSKGTNDTDSANKGYIFLGKVSKILPEGHPEWRRHLGQLLENRYVILTVIVLVAIDLLLNIIIFVIEETKLLNPAIHEQSEEVMMRCKIVTVLLLLTFLVEQIGHFIAFGRHFFRKPWFVMDTVVVLISLTIELTELHEEVKTNRKFPEESSPIRRQTSEVHEAHPHLARVVTHSSAHLHSGLSGHLGAHTSPKHAHRHRRKNIRMVKRAARLIMILQLWKFLSFAFDVMLASRLYIGVEKQRADYIRMLEHELTIRHIPLPQLPEE